MVNPEKNVYVELDLDRHMPHASDKARRRITDIISSAVKETIEQFDITTVFFYEKACQVAKLAS